MEQKIKDFSY